MRHWLRSIRTKLLLIMLAVNACTLLVASAAFFIHDMSDNSARSVRELTTLADILGQGSATALEFDDPRVANDTLAQLRGDADIHAAAIYTSSGQIFAKYLSPQWADATVPLTPSAAGVQIERQSISVLRPVNGASGGLGFVYVVGNYDAAGWLRDYLLIFGSVLLASLAIGLLVSSRLQRHFTRPVLAVGQVAQEVMERRDFSLRAAKSTEDEIGRLAESFNGMLQTLEHEIAVRSAAEQEVRTLNAELERRVEHRTAELEVRTREAEAASQAKADFLANMSHEIRTPMNAVLGLAYLLANRSLDADSLDLVRKIRNAGRSLQTIINDILDFSKIEAGQLDIEEAPLQLEAMLENLSSIMSANVGDKDVELIISPAPDTGGELRGDALRVEQILINLTGNAIKFTQHGNVRVGLSLLSRTETSALIRFSVSDTGIGIAPEKQTHIFSAFAQADASTTRQFGGTGLGLSICRQLVHKMGGEIGVISSPGRGSEFWFTIPFRWSPAKLYEPPSLAKLEVLIADDSNVARENLALTSRAMGWTPTLAESGEEALGKIRNRRQGPLGFDVLLLDWKMPVMDGLALARTIREELDGLPPPIVLMVTAFSRDELLRCGATGLIDGVLTKPVTTSTLYNSVAQVLRQRSTGEGSGASAASQQRRLAGIRVLVVDDSDINCEVADRILSGEGASVRLAENGQDALIWLQGHVGQVDVVLMDVQMPEMDGYETTRLLRQSEPLAGLPVVALTAGAFKVQQDEARKAGMNAFVAKPFDVEELIQVILRLAPVPRPDEPDEPDGSMRTSGPQAPPVEVFPGIDTHAALAVWKEPAVHQRFLLKFLRDNTGLVELLQQLLQAQDLAEVASRLHKLKGAAGNLALPQLAHAAEALEQAGNEAARVRALEDLTQAFEQVLRSAARYAGEPVPVAAEPEVTLPIDAERIKPLLVNLLQALEGHDPDLATPALRDLRGLLPSAQLAGLCRSVDDFDFREARRLVHQLAEDLRDSRE